MSMKRQRQADSFDSEEQEESETSDDQGPSFMTDSGDTLHLSPKTYHHDAATGLPLFRTCSQQQHSQSSSIASFPPLSINNERRDSGQWRPDQMLDPPHIPNASRVSQVVPAASGANEDTHKAAGEIESKKRRYERTLPCELSMDYQALVPTDTPLAQEDGFRSLNRLIDRFIESAEKVTEDDDHHPTPSNLARTGSHVQSLPTLSSIPELGAPLCSSSETGYFQGGNTVDILHQRTPRALSDFPGHVVQSTTVQQSTVLPNRALKSQITTSSTNSTASINSSRNLYLPQDSENLSMYQCFLRQQIEFFAADWDDIAVIQGRNWPVTRRQVGIRCIHCAHLPIKSRGKGSSYFSSRLDALYQSAQNLAKKHLLENCRHIPSSVREQLLQLKNARLVSNNPQSGGSGKGYWAEAATKVGVFEDTTNERLEFRF